MRCVQINEAGQLVDVVPQPATVAECALVLQSGQDVASPDLAALGITPAAFASVVGGAFALVVGAWAFGWAVSAIYAAIRRV